MDVCVCVSKAACVLERWRSVKGCGVASCFSGCSTSPSHHLGWTTKGFESNSSAAPLPGNSADNTAHPQTRGSTEQKQGENVIYV